MIFEKTHVNAWYSICVHACIATIWHACERVSKLYSRIHARQFTRVKCIILSHARTYKSFFRQCSRVHARKCWNIQKTKYVKCFSENWFWWPVLFHMSWVIKHFGFHSPPVLDALLQHSFTVQLLERNKIRCLLTPVVFETTGYQFRCLIENCHRSINEWILRFNIISNFLKFFSFTCFIDLLSKIVITKNNIW
jgi:hypothetical protein